MYIISEYAYVVEEYCYRSVNTGHGPALGQYLRRGLNISLAYLRTGPGTFTVDTTPPCKVNSNYNATVQNKVNSYCIFTALRDTLMESQTVTYFSLAHLLLFCEMDKPIIKYYSLNTGPDYNLRVFLNLLAH